MIVREEMSTPMTKSKRRSFTAEFKTQVVLEVIGGIKTFSEACRQYQVSEQTLRRWKQEFVQYEQAGRSLECRDSSLCGIWMASDLTPFHQGLIFLTSKIS